MLFVVVEKCIKKNAIENVEYIKILCDVHTVETAQCTHQRNKVREKKFCV